MSIEQFNPSGWAVKNGNFIGLPFSAETAKIILLPVPWEATVSYNPGTAHGPENIREASYQLDLFDYDVADAWQLGIHMLPSDQDLLSLSDQTRILATGCIDALESGQEADAQAQALVNQNCEKMIQWVYEQTQHWMNQGKLVGLIGGDHSTPLGYLRALGEKYTEFGILHIDAHADLRQAYEGFTYSHASIFYNAIKEVSSIKTLVQVGIRDYCEEEILFAEENDTKVKIFFDHEIKRRGYQGESFQQICQNILSYLPKQVYISFDIDALDPKLCPNTGTPVAGGFELQEVFYLCRQLLDAGIQIIGFDVNEVGSASEWDGNVGARAVYKVANLMGASHRQVL